MAMQTIIRRSFPGVVLLLIAVVAYLQVRGTAALIEALLIASGVLTFAVVGAAVWLPSGRRAIAAARAASQLTDPAAGAVAVENE